MLGRVLSGQTARTPSPPPRARISGAAGEPARSWGRPSGGVTRVEGVAGSPGPAGWRGRGGDPCVCLHLLRLVWFMTLCTCLELEPVGPQVPRGPGAPVRPQLRRGGRGRWPLWTVGPPSGFHTLGHQNRGRKTETAESLFLRPLPQPSLLGPRASPHRPPSGASRAHRTPLPSPAALGLSRAVVQSEEAAPPQVL